MAQIGAITVTIRARGFRRMSRVLARVWTRLHRLMGHHVEARYESHNMVVLRCSCGSSIDLFGVEVTPDR